MPGKSFDRAVRKNHIFTGFVNRFKNGKREEVTSSKVARALMLEPSAHVRGLLAELVRDGLITARKVEDKRASNLKGENAFTVYYQLSESEVKKLKADEREIDVKKGGVSVGQLRMF
jgi:hypothetical protein